MYHEAYSLVQGGKKQYFLSFSTVTFFLGCSCSMFPLTLWFLYQLVKRFNASLFEGKQEECSYNHLLARAPYVLWHQCGRGSDKQDWLVEIHIKKLEFFPFGTLLMKWLEERVMWFTRRGWRKLKNKALTLLFPPSN